MQHGIPRTLEAAAAALALVALSPLLALLALAVAASSRGPVLFRQQRVGRGGRPFTMLKFRTMRVGGGGAQVTAAGDGRVTAVGRWLRRLKLDELPELVNVVRGELALVGPRPEVPRYVEAEDSRWRRVLEERPGITHPVTLRLADEEGLIAAAGGDPERFYVEELLPWKLAGYLEYAAARSWRSDLAVLAATAGALVGRRCYARVELDEVRAAGGGERHG
jgi:lipopolysaccharide/colanic/teichoic acid biosynthesis glycosyltransferase